jgi:quercetin dioxygenase-like cupin family protein
MQRNNIGFIFICIFWCTSLWNYTFLRAQQRQPLGLTKWDTTASKIVPGMARMFLVGNPFKHELFAARFRYPDGASVKPHWHTTTVDATVLEGTLIIGFGEKFDTSAVKEYGPGSFIVIEGGVRHFEMFRGETIIHVEGVGPFKTEFVNPANDPRIN